MFRWGHRLVKSATFLWSTLHPSAGRVGVMTWRYGQIYIYIYICARCSFMYSCKNAVRVSVEASTVTVAQWHFLPSLRCGKRTWVASFELTIMPETILSTLLWMFTSSGEISRESTRISRQICAKADIVTRNSRRIYKVSQLRHS